jgi:GT2 family glycosyltransferase
MEKVNNQNHPNPLPSAVAEAMADKEGQGIKPVDLSIIIVSYKSKDHLAVLLPSIFESRGVSFSSARLSSAEALAKADGDTYRAEVIIVDNGSNDGTLQWLGVSFSHGREKTSPLQIVENVNNGFSAGNNLGIKRASGKYILLLNPDTKLQPDTLETMLDFMESRSDVGISGCKLIKGDGKLDLACRRRFPNPWNSFKRLFLRNNQDYNYTDISENQSMEVDSVVGAFMLIRKSALSLFPSPAGGGGQGGGGPLDENFFMYGEDLDLCWRCKTAGYKVWYYPKTFATHYKGESSKKAPFVMLKAFHDSMWIFYKKHYYQKYPFFLNWLVFCGIYLRLGALILINLFKSNPRVSK